MLVNSTSFDAVFLQSFRFSQDVLVSLFSSHGQKRFCPEIVVLIAVLLFLPSFSDSSFFTLSLSLSVSLSTPLSISPLCHSILSPFLATCLLPFDTFFNLYTFLYVFILLTLSLYLCLCILFMRNLVVSASHNTVLVDFFAVCELCGITFYCLQFLL